MYKITAYVNLPYEDGSAVIDDTENVLGFFLEQDGLEVYSIICEDVTDQDEIERIEEEAFKENVREVAEEEAKEVIARKLTFDDVTNEAKEMVAVIILESGHAELVPAEYGGSATSLLIL